MRETLACLDSLFFYVYHRPASSFFFFLKMVHSGWLKRAENVKRGRGRPNLTWEESVKRDMKDWSTTKELAMDRGAWKLAIHVSEP